MQYTVLYASQLEPRPVRQKEHHYPERALALRSAEVIGGRRV